MHVPQSPDIISTPSSSKIGFEGNPFCGESMCLLDIISDFKQGRPKNLYFIGRLGASKTADGWRMEYGSDFETISLAGDSGNGCKLVPAADQKPVNGKGDIVGQQELKDYCDTFLDCTPFPIFPSIATRFRPIVHLK